MSIPYLTVTERDRQFFTDHIRGRLPADVVDIHAHTWLRSFERASLGGAPPRANDWARLAARDNPLEVLSDTYRSLLPGVRTQAAVFGFPAPDIDVASSNDYVATQAPLFGYFPIALTRPEWSAEALVRMLDRGRFIGSKVYLEFAAHGIPLERMRIFDFAPHHQLEVLNERHAVLILHIPRSGRLADPQNVQDLLALARHYPDIQAVVAHVGRAYCLEDIGDAFDRLAGETSLLFDTSANCNAGVIAEAWRRVGPTRLLFGSDMPITRMKLRRVCRDGTYVNFVRKGVLGDLAHISHMQGVDGEEADSLTYFLYEEIAAILRAADDLEASTADLYALFAANAKRVLHIAESIYVSQGA